MAFFTTVRAEIPFIPSCLDQNDEDTESDSDSELDQEDLLPTGSKNSTLKHGEILTSDSKKSPVTVTVNGQIQNFSVDDDNYSSGCSTPTPAAAKKQQPQERFDYEIDPDIGVIV